VKGKCKMKGRKPPKAQKGKNPGLAVFLGLRNSLFQIIEFVPDLFGQTGSELG
jgi:hypothetical protein